jgi:D-glycero-alpha-D-manno-heptose-7-phosphate kinase
VLHASYAHLNQIHDAETLARQACEIEVCTLRKPMGKQDQFIAAYGGLRFIRFLPDESVVVESVNLNGEQRRGFQEYLMLFYTNVSRKAETILAEQESNITLRIETLRRLKQLAIEGRACLERGAYGEFGRLLHEGWQYKKQLASKISNGAIDEMYNAAHTAGALGGKITGAGGGGFLLLWCPPERQEQVRAALAPLPELPVRPESGGTKVIFNYVHS